MPRTPLVRRTVRLTSHDPYRRPFFDVVARVTLGENAAASLKKGHRVLVTGRMKHAYRETDDGDKRSKLELAADDIGASLRWAQADIAKVTRTESDASSPAYNLSRPKSPSDPRRWRTLPLPRLRPTCAP